MAFIKIGDRRVNMDMVLEYQPVEKLLFNKNHNYSIKFKLINDSEEFFRFFDKLEERDAFIEKLDQKYLDYE